MREMEYWNLAAKYPSYNPDEAGIIIYRNRKRKLRVAHTSNIRMWSTGGQGELIAYSCSSTLPLFVRQTLLQDFKEQKKNLVKPE